MNEATLLVKALGNVERLPVNSFSPSEMMETVRDTQRSLEAQTFMSFPCATLAACCLYNNGLATALLSAADRVALKDIAQRAYDKYQALCSHNIIAQSVFQDLGHISGRF